MKELVAESVYIIAIVKGAWLTTSIIIIVHLCLLGVRLEVGSRTLQQSYQDQTEETRSHLLISTISSCLPPSPRPGRIWARNTGYDRISR